MQNSQDPTLVPQGGGRRTLRKNWSSEGVGHRTGKSALNLKQQFSGEMREKKTQRGKI